jgi:hypothetical protein
MTIMVVTHNQLEQLKELDGNFTKANARFLEPNVNFFTHITQVRIHTWCIVRRVRVSTLMIACNLLRLVVKSQNHNFTIYFQKHGDDYVIAFYLNPTVKNTTVSVQFQYSAVFDYGT